MKNEIANFYLEVYDYFRFSRGLERWIYYYDVLKVCVKPKFLIATVLDWKCSLVNSYELFIFIHHLLIFTMIFGSWEKLFYGTPDLNKIEYGFLVITYKIKIVKFWNY